MTAPKVSVCVPTFNRAEHLAEALQSVACQTEQDFEIVVSDDASTDDTAHVMRRSADSRIRYLRATRNAGIAANRNRCLDAARGRYIAWLDSDDVYEPDMLETQCDVLDRNPDVALVHGGAQVIDRAGRRLRDWTPPFSADTVESGAAAFRELIVSNYITAPTVIVRRSCHDRVGPYATDIGRSSTDWEMWLRLTLHGRIAYTARTLAKYRQHDASVSQATSANGERLRCDIAVVERIFAGYADLVPEPVACRRRADAALGAKAILASTEAVTAGRWSDAEEFVRLAIALVPTPSLRRGFDRLLAGVSARSEYMHHRWSKRALRDVAMVLDGTRLAEQLRRVAASDPEWDRTLAHSAGVVRRWVPARSRVAAIDKWDPTLLHLSHRRGWHFPHRGFLPNGYPADSLAAILHLEQLQHEGAEYLVVPGTAFWWLEHYDGFRTHLETRCDVVWTDEQCRLYRLTPAGASTRVSGSVHDGG